MAVDVLLLAIDDGEKDKAKNKCVWTGERIRRYRLMGYSAERLAFLSGWPASDVILYLMSCGL